MKIFKKVKEIRSRSGELHFTRFAIFETNRFSIYLHKVYMADQDNHLHNHPWNWCFAIPLFGKYFEETPDGIKLKKGISIMKPNNFHKIKEVPKYAMSLFFAGKRLPSWGYMVDGELIDNVEYRKMKRDGEVQ